MILIFNEKSIFSCLVAIISSFINCKVLITSSDKSYFLKKLDRLGLNIECKRLLFLDMSKIKLNDLSIINGDGNKVSNYCAKNLYENLDYYIDFSKFFPNIKNLNEKLKVFIYEYYDELFIKQQLIIKWLEFSNYKDNLILNLSSLKPGSKSFWQKSNLKIIFIFNYFSFFTNFIIKLNFKVIKKITQLFRYKFKILKKKNNFKNKYSIANNPCDVLFFPHSGVVSFGHPPKDYFYSDKIDSPFHPSKIIHLDYNCIKDLEEEKKKIKRYFKIDFIFFERLKNSYLPWYGAIKLIIEILKKTNKFKFKNLGSNILFYSIIFMRFVVFSRYCKSLEPYSSAKVALVGYEMLFPKTLALALETLNIKSISVTERFQAIYKNNKTFIIDTLLSISHSSSKIIQNSERFLAKNILPVGQVRTDHFIYNNVLKSEFNERIVILDYHVENDSESQKFKTILNWKNDKNFREEIISLAELYPDKEFIFRGKNCDWYKNKIFPDIIAKVDKLPNLKVDQDYNHNHWKSYHLCASANLIIARPTSLAEECVSKGYNVIVMDYSTNYRTAVTNFLPEPLKEYYCHSYKELLQMFEFWNHNKYILSDKKKNEIKKNLFSGFTDGNVKTRIQKYLNIFYSMSQQSKNIDPKVLL